jgi:universal stress protein A
MQNVLADPALAGLAVRTVIQTGTAARQILHFAAAQAAGLIVLGAHGATGLTRFLMGSTAESVLRGAACPTLLFTVKPTE